MLVEINLLPRKERKAKPLLLLLVIVLIATMASLLIFFYLGKQYENNLTQTNDQIIKTQELTASHQALLKSVESSSASDELKSTIDWATTYPVKLVPIVKYLTELLPERGFIQELTYEETGELLVTVQFDQSREAGFYQYHLSQSDWFTNAFLESVTTGEFYLIEEGYDENKIGNKTYVPRYTAEYKLTINDAFLINEQKKNTSNESKSEAASSEEGETSS